MPPAPSPTYERLRDYVTRRMRMSHIYQPLMLMELLGRRSPAPVQDVARRILGENVTQIDRSPATASTSTATAPTALSAQAAERRRARSFWPSAASAWSPSAPGAAANAAARAVA
ncbi:hypothetical protein KBY93_08555 [Synechococcus sp. J7-Johnson]|uniref:hypothetical protein n=1 Tax=Synechococcus sp. J7-Johnson TaxID=2823737 RepID=UPI0020CDC2A6|nr:hypothetical protein [Synechococcus sp. J7-Johnson]MCP9840687.1 hypothetical protein [Synechococcus sp. J7-Johnson]